MSGYSARALAGLAGLAISTAAFGQVAAPFHPVFGDNEVVGTGENNGNALVVVGLAGTTDPGAVPADGDFEIQFYAADGTTPVGGAQAVAAADITILDDNNDAGEVESGDAIQIDVSSYIQGAAFTAAEFAIIHTVGGDGELTDGTVGDESTNTRFSINRNQPTLISALFNTNAMDTTMSELFLVFSIDDFEDLDGSTVAGSDIALAQADQAFVIADNPNDTEVAGLTNTDFEISADNMSFAALDAADVASFAVADGSIFITVTFDEATSDLDDTSQFIRVAAAGDVYDSTGQHADSAAVQIETKEDFAAMAANWQSSFAGGSGANAGALAVTFTGPVDPGNLGDTTFYDNLMVEMGAAGLNVTAVDGVDGDDPNTVLLTVTSGGGEEGVDANGLFDDFNDGVADEGEFSIELDEMTGTLPADLFGDDYAGSDDLTIGDEIAPSNIGDVKFYDKDGDGKIDAVAVTFDESMGGTPTAAGWTLNKVGGVTVNPIDQINEDTGELVEDETEAADDPADDEITITDVLIVDFDFDGDGEIEPNETANTIQFCFDPDSVDWDEDGLTGSDDDEEAAPGTGDAGALSIEYTDADGDDSIADATGNLFESDIAADTADEDCAPALLVNAFYFTGDNQFGGSNIQFYRELDGQVGDQDDNNRAALCFSEDIDTGGIDGNFIQIGTMGTVFDDGDDDELFTSDNCVTLESDTVEGELVPGATITLREGNGITGDSDNSEVDGSAMLVDKNGPYVPLIVDINGAAVDAAFLIDTNGDGFADQARVNFTESIDPATLDADDWFISVVNDAPNSATVDTGDDSLVIFNFTDGLASMANPVEIQYLAATNDVEDEDLFAGVDGVPVANADHTGLEAADITEPDVDNHGIAQMPVIGTIMDGDGPARRGTKVFAMLAVPTCKEIYATHNNVRFVTDDTGCCWAWDNFLYGIEPFVYLNRQDDNYQCYYNYKYDGNDTATFTDIIWMDKVNARDLEKVTFSGVGETKDDKVQNGQIIMGWDVLRSNDGSLSDLFDDGVGNTPIVSSAVLTGDDGSFSMHVGAPIFQGRGNDILGNLDLPVIFVIEEPDGTRHAVSSLLTSADMTNHAGGPIIFQAQQFDDENGTAFEATRLDVNLDNVGMVKVFEGWNAEGFNHNSGWAERSNNVPTLPNGVSQDNIVIGSDLPNVGPLNQFVLWYDDESDGVWDTLDGGLNDIIIDAECIDHFTFTYTSFGPQFSAGMTNLVGGYGFAMFLNEVSDGYGIFQFGAELSSTMPFANYQNNSANAGWALFTQQVAASATDMVAGSFDYLIAIRNNGGDDTGNLEVKSLADSPNNPNDLENVSKGEALFGHTVR